MTKKKTKVLIIIIIVGISWVVGRIFFFYVAGSQSGKIIDAVTGEPIKDAVVYYQWNLEGGFMESSQRFGASHETKTNKNGNYYIPSHLVMKHFLYWNAAPGEMLAYKEGYIWYRVVYGETQHFRTYGPDVKSKYRRRGNLIKLQPWIDDISHEEHMDIFTSKYRHKGTLLKEALKNEMVFAECETRSKESQERRSNKLCYELMRAKRKYENNEMTRKEFITRLYEGSASSNPQTLKFVSSSLEELGDKSSVLVLIKFLKMNLYRDDFVEIFGYLRKVIDRDGLLVITDEVAIIRDISERKKALAELEELCQEYVNKSAISSTPHSS